MTGCHAGCVLWVWRWPGEVGSGQRDVVRVAAGMHAAARGGQRFAVLHALLEMIPNSMHFGPFWLE